MEVRIQTGVCVCFAGGEEWDVAESEDNPPYPPSRMREDLWLPCPVWGLGPSSALRQALDVVA